MNNIIFKNVVKNYGKTQVVKKLDLEIKAGERLVLLGPSGCGKSTTLRLIAGLEEISSGELYLGEKLANSLAPGDRGIGMVFQNYALLPHLNVWENIKFGLFNIKINEKEKTERIEEAIELLNLKGLEKRFPKELSGGQRQRVALGRGIVKRAPYFLLDEPLSNLDAQLRNIARRELVKIHEMYKPTFIYVTHDQVEAMTVGERVAILNEGYLQQVDTPDNIYNKPVNTFVAKFIGSPAMNIIDVEINNNKMNLNNEGIDIPEKWREYLRGKTKVKFGFRPEEMEVRKSEEGIDVDYIENHGNKKCIYFLLNNEKCIVTVDSFTDIKSGSKIKYKIDWNKVHFFSNEEGKNLKYCDEEEDSREKVVV